MANSVRIDPAKLAALIRSPTGPIAREMLVDGEIVRQEAKRLVGVSEPDPVPRRVTHRPGTLRDSIVKRPFFTASGIFGVQVGSEQPYAEFHHEGTPRHDIAPRPGKRLVFFSARAGRIIYMRPGQVVDHPGTRPNQFLTNALQALRGRY